VRDAGGDSLDMVRTWVVCFVHDAGVVTMFCFGVPAQCNHWLQVEVGMARKRSAWFSISIIFFAQTPT
jgi:hypothetical protein